MAVIYLRHAQHGAKVAISEVEAEQDMQNGWEEFDPTALAAENDSEDGDLTDGFAPSPAGVVNALPKRRGRRPREFRE